MAYQYRKISEKNISGGINRRATENTLEATFSEDLKNYDTNSDGFLANRRGYQGSFGFVPLRVTQVEHDGTTIVLCFAPSISLIDLTAAPLVVRGKLASAQSGDFSTTDAVVYYSTFSSDPRKELTAPSGTIEIDQSAHAISNINILIAALNSTSPTASDNELFFFDAVQIDETTFNVDFDHVTATTTDSFIILKDGSTVTGTSFVKTFVSGDWTGSPLTISIPTATHNLTGTQIIPILYRDTGSEREQVFPDTLTISSAGVISLTVSSAFDGHAVFVTTTGTLEETILAGTSTITVTNPGGKFFFTAAYTVSSGTLTYIIPDSVIYNESADTLALTVTVSASTTLRFFFLSGTPTSNCIEVTDAGSVSTSYTDTNPQMTVWGISHSGIYPGSPVAGGHVTHIDRYREPTQEVVISGLGGNLFTQKTRADGQTTFLIPSTTVDLSERTSGDITIAPVFFTTGSGATRTNGKVEATDITSGNLAIVDSVAFVSSSVAKYTLTLTSKTGTLAAAIAVGDELVITGMARNIHNGTFSITAVSDAENSITVTNTGVIDATFDETFADGRAGIFTDTLTLAATTPFVASDTMTSTIFGSLTATVISTSGTSLKLRGITAQTTIPSTQLLTASRSTGTVPVISTTNFVTGDICIFTGLNQKLRVTGLSTPNSTLTFDETLTASHNDTVTVEGRWTPTEAPTTNSNIVQHFDSKDAVTQDIMRSTSVNDNLYLTNASDEVFKYDGTNLYRAGFFRWQPKLFVRTETSGGSISASTLIATFSAGATSKVVASDSVLGFAIGDVVYDNGATPKRLIVVEVDIDNKTVTLDDAPDGAATVIRKSRRLRYYFRINAIDANDNIVASAVTGNVDFVVEVQNSAVDVKISILKFPRFDIYDYAKIEVRAFREEPFLSGNFFLVAAEELDVASKPPYIEISDETDEFGLSERDEVQIALDAEYSPGQAVELFTAIDEPQRAKFITTASNKLLLGNLKAYPQIELDLRRKTSVAVADLDGETFALTGIGSFMFTSDGGSTSSTSTDYAAITDITVTSAATVTATDELTADSGDAFYKNGDTVAIAGITGTPDADYFVVDSSGSPSSTLKKVYGISLTSGGAAITGLSGGPGTSLNRSRFSIQTGTISLATPGGWIYTYYALVSSSGSALLHAGWFPVEEFIQVDSVGNFTVDLTHGLTADPSEHPDKCVFSKSSGTVVIPVNMESDFNYLWAGGQTPLDTITPSFEFLAMIRMADAINATSAITIDGNLTVPGTGTLISITAAAGSEIGLGKLILRQVKAEATDFSLTISAGWAGKTSLSLTSPQADIPGGDVLISPETRTFPSRVIASATNFPELFDGPTGFSEDFADVFDVNPADGQEVTGIIPFFGSAVFGTGQKEGFVVVFKTSSIYLIDLNTKQISKLQTEGIGCSVPFSIAYTRNGIIFANEAGIYRLNRDQNIEYVGKFVERIWEDEVNFIDISRATGHHYNFGKQYKLSVPIGTTSSLNTQVLVYEHEREQDRRFGAGAWARYTNHPATGWVNVQDDAFFGSTTGDVFSIRNLGEASDYRDDASAVGGAGGAEVTYRAMDFGIAGIRKIISSVIAHFQMRYTSISSVEFLAAVDLSSSFESLGTVTITKGSVKVQSIKFSLPKRKAEYLQIKIKSTAKDVSVILAGLDFNVAALTEKGIKNRVDST